MDIGSSSLRAGYAGDDTPKAIIPTSYGFISSQSSDPDIIMAEGDGAEAEKPREDSKLFIGQHGPSIWREGMEIGSPMKDSLSA